jgi:hypothetical protein
VGKVTMAILEVEDETYSPAVTEKIQSQTIMKLKET